MINHVRTLLLNQPGTNSPGSGYPGEEFVPPAFQPKALPSSIVAVHRALFGDRSDRVLMNWRLRAYLGLLHSNELSEYVTGLDPRITYLPIRNDLFDMAARGPLVTTVTNPDSQRLTVLCNFLALRAANRCLYSWTVTVGANDVTVQYTDDGGNPKAIVTPYTITDGLSNVISLPGTDASIRFSSGSGASWNIELVLQPGRTFPEIVSDVEAALTVDREEVIFGKTPVEPYLTFSNLWNKHDQMLYRLSGLLLGLAYRINDYGG